jgi:hypothetical protein
LRGDRWLHTANFTSTGGVSPDQTPVR